MLEQIIVSIQIIIIDIVMAADNAIIIGLIASSFADKNRKRIIAYGVAAAFIFRIFFALGAVYVLQFAWLKILGGVLLLWIIYTPFKLVEVFYLYRYGIFMLGFYRNY